MKRSIFQVQNDARSRPTQVVRFSPPRPASRKRPLLLVDGDEVARVSRHPLHVTGLAAFRHLTA